MLWSCTTPQTQGPLNQAHQAPSVWKDMDMFLPGTYVFHLQLPHNACVLMDSHSLLPKTQTREGQEGGKERGKERGNDGERENQFY